MYLLVHVSGDGVLQNNVAQNIIKDIIHTFLFMVHFIFFFSRYTRGKDFDSNLFI